MEDDEGWGVVGMAIQSSCGQSEKEEAVRLVVGRWGVAAGPRGGRDRHGWTALHLAALLSSPQTVSVLLNRGASLSAVNDAGFTPFDLVTGMDGREDLTLLLDPWAGSAPNTATRATFDDVPRISAERRAQIQRRRIRVATRAARARRKAEQAGVAAERERWIRERAKHIGVDATVLFAPPKPRGKVDEDEEEEEEEEEVNDASLDEMEVDEALGGVALADEVRAKVSEQKAWVIADAAGGHGRVHAGLLPPPTPGRVRCLYHVISASMPAPKPPRTTRQRAVPVCPLRPLSLRRGLVGRAAMGSCGGY